MAGEIHNNLPRRRKLPWRDDRSTNKYYASNDTSAIQGNNVASDSTLKPGEAPKPNVTGAKMHRDERSADKKYYGNAAPAAPTAQQIAKGQLGAAPRLGGAAKQASNAPQKRRQAALSPNANLTVTETNEVNGVMLGVIAALESGVSPVVVYVESGNAQLLRRTRAALEMLVTREQITEEQFHDVRLSYTPSDNDKKAIDAKIGTVTPRGDAKVESVEKALPADPLAFLRGEGDDPDDPVVDTSPINMKEVDASKDEVSSVVGYPSAPDDDDDGADNSFLQPKEEAVPINTGKQTLVDTSHELDRAVETNIPVKVLEAMEGVGDSEPPALPDRDIQVDEAMPGIGDAPQSRRHKPGRRSGRGS